MLNVRSQRSLELPLMDEMPEPEYDDLIEYCEFVSLICLESEFRERNAEHKAIDEM